MEPLRSPSRPLSPWALLLALAACEPSSELAGGAGGEGGEGQGAAGPNGTGTGAAGPGSTGTTDPGEGSLAVVVIDIQETFVDGASNPDIASVLDRSGELFARAEAHDTPFLITFEASQSGDHALHAPLVPMLPDHAEDFTKTTFAATGLSSFATAIQGSGATHVVVVGAETDVCVLQTVLGLRELGFEVLLQRDAVFSEETNVGPSLRRFEQAGGTLVTEAEVLAFFEGAPLPAASAATARRVRPLEMGVALVDFSNASFEASDDAVRVAKVARLRELLLVSEWFERPVYVEDPAAGLPAALDQFYLGELRSFDDLASDAEVTQLVVAGTDGDVAGTIGPWLGARELFVMEDALLTQGSAAQQSTALAPLFDAGLVPTTYKTFYYEMTRSVDLDEWPSEDWVARLDEYWDITQAPEDLPPIAPAD